MNPTSAPQWHTLVNQAQHLTGSTITDQAENYLVGLLAQFSAKPLMMARVLAFDYLNDPLLQAKSRSERLKDIGDHCLLFAGLFPQHAERRQVRLGHMVELGQNAYHQLHESAPFEAGGLYSDLARGFVTLMDLLHAIRELRDERARLSPLHAFDLWSDTGSRHALRVIRTFTDATPVRSPQYSDSFLM
ncbi:MAG: hypothetical protein IT489_08640 [Gammaproteobacteria bacterium]|nr:hypothetical protein [Gammaproteobacteria bacterium]